MQPKLVNFYSLWHFMLTFKIKTVKNKMFDNLNIYFFDLYFLRMTYVATSLQIKKYITANKIYNHIRKL